MDVVQGIQLGNFRSIAKALSAVENESHGYFDILHALKRNPSSKLIGITGPPGAGKSTLINALLHTWTAEQKKVAILSVDPSSPFNYGALLGDRIRMSDFYTNELVYIRSVASRGNLGGLAPKIIEMSDILCASVFDYVVLETVGVGQSEVEIANLANTTIVTVVPEAGDEIQTMKAGVMEIADIFVVNKADRPQADTFLKNLKALAHSRINEPKVLKCIATEQDGIPALIDAIDQHAQRQKTEGLNLMHFKKAIELIQQEQLKAIDMPLLKTDLLKASQRSDFNLYRFLSQRFDFFTK